METEKNNMREINLPISAEDWLTYGDRGISSETMFGVLLGLRISKYISHPLDPSDFGRCYKLLKAVPEWNNKESLDKIAKLSPIWSNITANWDKLCEMLLDQYEKWNTGNLRKKEMYDYMKSLGC